ncbi:MAG: FG-GAP repeat protein [Bdellovibrionaceae bacterium]|nr:FG-GAP repeat protein [Pseudobdellovibrionaceae bacterium]
MCFTRWKSISKILALLFFTALAGCTGGGVQSGSVIQTFIGVDEIIVLSPTTVKLTWSKLANVKEYKIYNSSSSQPIATTTLDFYLIKDLTPNSVYTFKVVGTSDSAQYGFDRELSVTMWPRFKGITTATLLNSTSAELTWDYPYKPQKYQVFYLKDQTPTASNTDNWKRANMETADNKIVIPNLAGSSTYSFIVHALYQEKESEITSQVLSVSTPAGFTQPTYSLSPISIGNLPSISVTPVPDAKHAINFFKTTVLWKGNPISDPLMGQGSIVLSSGANLPLGKITDLSLKVEYQDGNLTESMNVPGLSTFIKGIPLHIEKPSVPSLGSGTSYMGKAVAAGDFNCDGIDDLAIGIPDISLAQLGVKVLSAGAVFVYYSKFNAGTNSYFLNTTGTPSLTPNKPGEDPQIITFDDLALRERFGFSLSTGNLNGDQNGLNSCMDLIVGAPWARNTIAGRTNQHGAAYMFFGSTKGLSAPSHVADMPSNTSTCNGDLQASICTPVKLFEDPSTVPSALTTGQLTYTYAGNSNNYQTGYSVAFVGDFNADGFDDVAIGQPQTPFDGVIPGYNTYSGLIERVGSVLIFFGSRYGLGYEYPAAGGTPSAGDLKVRYLKIFPPVPITGSRFGEAIAGGADIDGKNKIRLADGRLAGGGDMVVGAPGFSYVDYTTSSPLRTKIDTTPDAASIIRLPSSLGWWQPSVSQTLSSSTHYYGFPQGGTAVGAAFVYFGRGSPTAPSMANIEVPSRASFWACGRRGLSFTEHYSCLVDNTNVRMLTPRDPNSRAFGSAVAVLGDKSRFKVLSNNSVLLTDTDPNPAVPRQYFSDTNRDGYADIVVTAPESNVGSKVRVGVLTTFYGNPDRLFNVADLYNLYSNNTPTSDYRINDPTCASYGTISALTKQNCAPVVIRSTSLADNSMIGANQKQIAVGDVTGDGIKDLAIGDSGDFVNAAGSGAALVFTSAQGLGLTATYKKIYSFSADAGDALGSSVTLGNFNGDFNSVPPPDGATTANTTFPYFDVFSGAPNDEVSHFGGGAVYGFLSSNTSLPSIVSTHSILITENIASFQDYGLGESRLVGDVNGDGYDDAVSKMVGVTATGQVSYDAVIYYGSSIGLVTTEFCIQNASRVFRSSSTSTSACYPQVTPSPGLTNSDIQLPQKISRPSNLDPLWAYMAVSAGDVNNDGFDDVLFIPSQSATNRSSTLYFGARGGLQNVVDPSWEPAAGDPQIVSQVFTVNQGSETDEFNMQSSNLRVPYVADDFNKDGYSDLAVGMPFETSPVMNKSSSLQPQPGYPNTVANGNGWVCGTDVLPECTGGQGIQYHGTIRIIYGSSRGYQTPRNNNYSGDITTGNTAAMVNMLDTETGGTKPCQNSSSPDPVCKAAYMHNPVFENINYGYSQLSHKFGFSVATADMNKDGYPDLLVSAPGFEDVSCWHGGSPNRDYGRVYIFYGSANGLLAGNQFEYYNRAYNVSCPVPAESDPASGLMVSSTKVRAIIPSLVTYGVGGNVTGRQFGITLSSAGDLNGDTYPDLAIGAPTESLSGLDNVGLSYIYYGPLCAADNESNVTSAFQRRDGSADNINRQMYYLGQAPAGTPTADIFNGALSPTYTAACFRGSGSMMKPMPQKFYVFGADANQSWGTTLIGNKISKGDFNLDGYDDLIVGSAIMGDVSRELTRVGAGIVYFGSSRGLYTAEYPNTMVSVNANMQARPFTILPTQFPNESLFFYGNSSVGDVNGDGTMDVMATSKYYNGTSDFRGINLGSFFLFY